MRDVLFALFGGMIGGLVVWLVASPSPPDLDERESTWGDRVAVEELNEGGVRSLRGDQAGLPVASTRAVPSDSREVRVGFNNPDRLLAIETEVSELRRRLELLEYSIPSASSSPDVAGSKISALRKRTNWRSSAMVLLPLARIPIRIRFLDSWPGHEDAAGHLSELVDELMRTHQKEKVIGLVDRFGTRIGVPAWRLDSYRLRAAYNTPQELRIANRIVNSSAPPRIRAWAMNVIGAAYRRKGEHALSIQQYEVVLASFSGYVDAKYAVAEARRARDKLVRGR